MLDLALRKFFRVTYFSQAFGDTPINMGMNL